MQEPQERAELDFEAALPGRLVLEKRKVQPAVEPALRDVRRILPEPAEQVRLALLVRTVQQTDGPELPEQRVFAEKYPCDSELEPQVWSHAVLTRELERDRPSLCGRNSIRFRVKQTGC